MPGMQQAMMGSYAKAKLPEDELEDNLLDDVLDPGPSGESGGHTGPEPGSMEGPNRNELPGDWIVERGEMEPPRGDTWGNIENQPGSGQADTGDGPVEIDWGQVGEVPLQQSDLPTYYGQDYGQELQAAMGQTFQDVGARGPASLEGASWQAAGGPAAATAAAGQASALGSEYFDPASVEGVPLTYSAGKIEETLHRDPVTGRSLIAAGMGGPGLVGTGTVDAVGGPTAAEILMEGTPEGREAQLSGLEQLRLLAGGDESSALQHQREQG